MKNSISIHQTGTNALQRVKWQYVSLAAGLAVAVSAAVGLGGNATTERTVTAPQRTAAVVPAPRAEGETVVFYLTSSAEQEQWANYLELEAAWVRLDNGTPEPRRSVHILDASQPGSQRFIDDAMAAANFTSTEAPRFVVVDLR